MRARCRGPLGLTRRSELRPAGRPAWRGRPTGEAWRRSRELRPPGGAARGRRRTVRPSGERPRVVDGVRVGGDVKVLGDRGASVGRRPTSSSMGCTPTKGVVPSACSAVRWASTPGRPTVKAASAVPQMRRPSGVRTISRPSCRLRTRSWSWTRPWSTSQSNTRLASSVRPPNSQCRMWWACRRSMRVSGQPGRAQPPSRRSSARRWASVPRRLRRPTARGSWPCSSMTTAVASQSMRRAWAPVIAEPPSKWARPAAVSSASTAASTCTTTSRRGGSPGRRSRCTRASASEPRAAMRRAAARSGTRPAAASSRQRSATVAVDRAAGAADLLVRGLRLLVLGTLAAGLALGQRVDPRSAARRRLRSGCGS